MKIVMMAASAAVALCAVPLSAAQANGLTVKHSDLDLSTTAGRDKLDERISRAARTICGMGPYRTLYDREVADQCMTSAKAEAQPNVDHLVVRAGYSSVAGN